MHVGHLLPAIAAGALSLLFLPAGDSVEQRLAIVVHKDNSTTNVTMDELRAIIKAERKFWSESNAIRLFTREKGSWEREMVLEKIFKMSEEEYSRYWLKQVYRGKVTAPPSVLNSTEETLKKIKGEPNAIGIIDASCVTADIKALTIDGKGTTDSDYPLKKAAQ